MRTLRAAYDVPHQCLLLPGVVLGDCVLLWRYRCEREESVNVHILMRILGLETIRLCDNAAALASKLTKMESITVVELQQLDNVHLTCLKADHIGVETKHMNTSAPSDDFGRSMRAVAGISSLEAHSKNH